PDFRGLLRCGISSRLMTGVGQTPKQPSGLLCQLSPAAEMPSHRLTTRSCQLRTHAPQQTILPGVGRTSTTHTTTQGTRPQFDWVRTEPTALSCVWLPSLGCEGRQ